MCEESSPRSPRHLDVDRRGTVSSCERREADERPDLSELDCIEIEPLGELPISEEAQEGLGLVQQKPLRNGRAHG